MSEEIFLIDSNSLITPHLTFYPFDFAPGFWNQLEQAITDGKIAILDMVKAEILHGNDALKDWMENLEIKKYIDHRHVFFRNIALFCNMSKIARGTNLLH